MTKNKMKKNVFQSISSKLIWPGIHFTAGDDYTRTTASVQV